ncbi:helix-turn-helix domain-containing protein [Geomonas silvestris]|uniref:helix-turn-helix domain-containing protein n=1 Tax=Geomonas silvestris TaxID=2740184 RepID=UPI00160A7C2E|nr:helix-turn-helix transcriptional regulator [Geomonas silvestris]
MIGSRIADYRRGLKFKVAEFARIIGISQGSLSDIENNKTKPSADTIEAIVRNTDINPGWLLTGVGPKRTGDYRTGDGRPFSSSKDTDQGEIDHDVMWNVVNVIQRILAGLGIDSKVFSQDKRIIIQNLLYADSKQKSGQVDEVYAALLGRLTLCEVCEIKNLKLRWQEKWRVWPGVGQDLDDVIISVEAPPGLKCPMEGKPREYITDRFPVTVYCTDYYRRLIDDGSLILVEGEPGGNPAPKTPVKQGAQVTQTVSGTGHSVAGRDIVGGSGRTKK